MSDTIKRVTVADSRAFVPLGVLLIAALALIWIGCAGVDGGPGGNEPPEVFLVNIPVDGTEFATSPVIKWFGTDRDGRIIRFDHTVVLIAEIDSVAAANGIPSAERLEWYIDHILTDEYPFWISIFVDEVVGNPNQDRVRLFASPLIAECDSAEIGGVTQPINCVSEVAEQYFFVRAIDDRGSVSDIKYRSFKRRNHWPETTISQNFNPNRGYVSLPKLTQTYNGIRLIWNGEDRLDFVPPAIPDLDYHWRVYGPYLEEPSADDTLGMSPIFESHNPDTLVGVWVRDTLADIWNLWTKVDQGNPVDTTRQGWFGFFVTARDDASISDSTPAFTTFQAIYPQFERKVLLVDDNWYAVDSYGIYGAGPITQSSQVNQEFFMRMLDVAYPEWELDKDVWWRDKSWRPNDNCRISVPPFFKRCGNYIDLELLAKHKLTIWIDDDIADPLRRAAPDVQGVMRAYLDAGGMLWITSRHGFCPEVECSQGTTPTIVDFSSANPAQQNDLAYFYFDLEKMYYPGWRSILFPQQVPEPYVTNPPATNDEFIGAVATASADPKLPRVLETDPERIANIFISQGVRSLLPGVPSPIGIPDVDFLIRGKNSTPLYLFQSWRPSGPVPPENNISYTHNRLVMLRRVGPSVEEPLYKVAYTSFPLVLIKEEQSMKLVDEMVKWFMLPFQLTPP